MPVLSEGFEALEDRLLRGGIAPRHVRRYLRELSEHLADLTLAQREAGYAGEEAAARARAVLGPDAELADAMLRQRDFRSISARFPWLVFLLMPPLALALLLTAFLQIIIFVTLAHLLSIIGIGPRAATAPWRFWSLVEAIQFFGNFVIVPAIALLFVALALRQRQRLLWPVFSSFLIVALSLHWDQQPWSIDPHGWGAAGVSYRLSGGANSVRFGFTPVFLYAWWKAVPQHGLTFAAQYLLTLLPLAWLIRTQRKIAAPA